MEHKRCRECGKSLAPDQWDDLCDLCTIGLVPASTATAFSDSFEAQHIIVEGRTLSGVCCPNCGAEFTQADLTEHRCAICGTEFAADHADQLISKAEVGGLSAADNAAGSLLGKEGQVPKDAPHS
jgi:hypothetical protein